MGETARRRCRLFTLRQSAPSRPYALFLGVHVLRWGRKWTRGWTRIGTDSSFYPRKPAMIGVIRDAIPPIPRVWVYQMGVT